MAERALITGITGQDGSYLAEYLLRRGYEVFGLIHGQRNPREGWLRRLVPAAQLVRGDLIDQVSLTQIIGSVQPDEVYNLGAVSHVPMSWDQAHLTAETTGLGALRMLDAIRVVCGNHSSRPAADGQIRFYQASSSEMFGLVTSARQDEHTPFHPRSPYAVAKVYAHLITQNYRESYGMHALSGILFNHESPRRGAEFVSRKISLGVASIKLGRTNTLALGNLDARRDWGYAPEYVVAMHAMLQQPLPRDYVIGTGAAHSVRDFVALAFDIVGLDWEAHVVADAAMQRPAEVEALCADPTRAQEDLGWTTRVEFDELVRLMVESDLDLLSKAPFEQGLRYEPWAAMTPEPEAAI